MKILLIGEYSRLHNSLKEGLIANGHKVTLVGSGDSFKKFPIDIQIDAKWIKKNKILTFLRQFIYKITRFDIASIETFLRFTNNIKDLSSFDTIQLINEFAFDTSAFIEKKLLAKIFKSNKNVYLLACGDDYTFISYLLSGQFEHSTLTPFLKDERLKKEYVHTLKCVSDSQRKISQYILQHIKGIIPASVEYVKAYENKPKVLPMIPNPINIDKINFQKFKDLKVIKIFHGINSFNILKKGNDYFTEALKVIAVTYPDKVKIITVTDMPYTKYFEKLKEAHIVLDQVYAHDQGYNALEAMAMGKVVFTGAGIHFDKHYQLKEKVAVNTRPDVNEIISNLSKLIEQPDLIKKIGINARTFIEEKHDYKIIAKKYLEAWRDQNLA